jgi:hypothetical protein
VTNRLTTAKPVYRHILSITEIGKSAVMDKAHTRKKSRKK